MKSCIALLFFLFIPCCIWGVDYEIFVEHSNPEISDKILSDLIEHGTEFFRKKYQGFEAETFVLYAQADQEILGGICGYLFKTPNSTCYVDYCSVAKNHRHQGIGSSLFRNLEAYVQKKGCKEIVLFTMEYQAPLFYEKLGFDCVGVIPQWIDCYDAIFFKKKLSKK